MWFGMEFTLAKLCFGPLLPKLSTTVSPYPWISQNKNAPIWSSSNNKYDLPRDDLRLTKQRTICPLYEVDNHGRTCARNQQWAQ